MQEFMKFGLPEQLINSLNELNFNTPTPVQEKVIPLALEGKDILGSAQTGTGKTGAFGIPLVAKLMSSPAGSAIVITPTRELAVQVMTMLRGFLGRRQNGPAIKTALLIGGESIVKQFHQLKASPRLIVGTPGRINDHLIRESLNLHDADFLVLDETDRMLDMGFTPQIDKIIKFLPKQRQTLLFSATLPKNIVVMAEKYLNQPVRVAIGFSSKPAANLKQEVLYVSESEKPGTLSTELSGREGAIMVFVERKRDAERIAKELRLKQHSAEAMHGDLNHHNRKRKIDSFRDSKYRIMVATGIAARGLDIAHVRHVIMYDLPRCPEDYIHCIGRTARAGAEGSAICFVTPGDKSKWRAINNLINPDSAQASEEKPRRFKPSNNNYNNSNNNNNNNNNRRRDSERKKRPDGAKGPTGGFKKYRGREAAKSA